MEALATPEPCLAAMAEAEAEFWKWFEPPISPRPITEFSYALTVTEGARPGPLDMRSHPGQWETLRAIDTGGFQRFVVIGPTQDGKTLVTLIVPTLYALCELRCPVVYGAPDMRMCADTWTEKLKPMLLASGLGQFLPQDGSASGGGTNVTTVRFHLGGTLFFVGGGGKNESAQASRTARYVFKDEVDSMKARLLPLLDRRADVYEEQARRFETSTIKDDIHSRILMRYNDSTRGRLVFRCPHEPCRKWQSLEWGRVKYDDVDDVTARDTARIFCLHCDAAITDDQRKEMIASEYRLLMHGQTVADDGTVTGTPPGSLTWGIRWTALDSPLKNLGVLAVQHRAARLKAEAGDHEDLRNFHRDQLCEGYTGDQRQVLEITLDYLRRRSAESSYDFGQVSEGVEFITAAIDVQLYWLYWSAMGHALDGRWWLIEAGVQDLIDPATKEQTKNPNVHQRRAALSAVRAIVANGWRRGETPVLVARRGVDVGYLIDEVRPWLVENIDWTGMVGRGETQVMRQMGATSSKRLVWIPGVVDVREQTDKWGVWPLWMADADSLKGRAHDGLLLPQGEPGAGHLFRGIEPRGRLDWVARHIAAEKRVRDEGSGTVTWETTGRHDILDTAMMNLGLGRAHAEYLKQQKQPTSVLPTTAPATDFQSGRTHRYERRHPRLRG
jgi:phage terminase large subunit GpA-like protein